MGRQGVRRRGTLTQPQQPRSQQSIAATRPLSILTQTTPDRPTDSRVASTASSVQCTGAGGVVVTGTLAAPLRTRRKRPMDGVRLDSTGRVQAFQPYEPFQPPSAGRSPRALQRLACDYLCIDPSLVTQLSCARTPRAALSVRRIAPMSVDPARRKAGGWLGAPDVPQASRKARVEPHAQPAVHRRCSAVSPPGLARHGGLHLAQQLTCHRTPGLCAARGAQELCCVALKSRSVCRALFWSR
jgi:hypothetical protein